MSDPISVALHPPRFMKSRKAPIRLGAPSTSPVWPLPAFNGREPSSLPAIGTQPRGVDLAYPRLDAVEMTAKCPPDSPNGTATHFMPNMVPVFAVDDGEITYAGRLSHGYGVVIDHGNGLATYYSNLEQLAAIRTDLYRKRAQHVRAGDMIGIVGAVSAGGFKHLHFELWRRGRDHLFAPVDPKQTMTGWTVLPWRDDLTPIEPPAAAKAA